MQYGFFKIIILHNTEPKYDTFRTIYLILLQPEENLTLPAEDLLGTENGGAVLAARADLAEGVGIGPMCVGLARAMYEEVLAYAKQRIAWGKPLTEYEHVAHKLIDIATKIAAMQGLVWQIAWAAENPDKAPSDIVKLSGMAKVFPSNMIWVLQRMHFK